jgi:4-hydroxy-4-methyl-2-oxoglutarate aldolase
MDDWTTATLIDAALRREAFFHIAPPGIRAVVPGTRVAGRVCPARHFGSVDVFLEAIMAASPGDLLVIDNNGRLDEACVGDLIALEAQTHRLGGIVIWGANRDTAEIKEIGLPVFSYGFWPSGPVRLDERTPDALDDAQFGATTVGRDHFVFADDDGVVFVRADDVDGLLATLKEIYERERKQADDVRKGRSLATQFHLQEYVAARERDPQLTLRAHLRKLKAEIEQ